MKVLIATDKPFAKVAVDGYSRDWSRRIWTGFTRKNITEKAQLLDAVKDANAIIIRSDIIDAEVLDAAKNWKLWFVPAPDMITLIWKLQRLTKFVDEYTRQNANAVAELALGMMVYAVRNFYNGTSGTERWVKTGYSCLWKCVGRNVARIARGFGMEIYAYDAFCPKEVGWELKGDSLWLCRWTL